MEPPGLQEAVPGPYWIHPSISEATQLLQGPLNDAMNGRRISGSVAPCKPPISTLLRPPHPLDQTLWAKLPPVKSTKPEMKQIRFLIPGSSRRNFTQSRPRRRNTNPSPDRRSAVISRTRVRTSFTAKEAGWVGGKKVGGTPPPHSECSPEHDVLHLGKRSLDEGLE